VYLAMRPPCPSTGPLVDQARGKIASIPAMGGAGNLNFHGNHGNADLPVATAFATSTDPYAPTGRGAAGSWGAPPVPKKGSLVGPILHWTAHGLMVVVMLVLAVMWLLEMETVRKKDAEITKISVEKKSSDEIITKKDAEIGGLIDFKTKLKIATKCSAEELEGFGEIDTVIPGNLLMDLAKRLKSKDGPGNSALSINKDEMLSKSFPLKSLHYVVAGDTIAKIRSLILEIEKSKDDVISEKNNAVKNLEMQMTASKAAGDQFRSIKEFGKLPEAQLVKAGPIELRFQLTDKDVKFMAAAHKVYERDEIASKSIRLLVLGMRPTDAFPVSALLKYGENIKKMNNSKGLSWKQIFEKANELTDRNGGNDKITSTTVLYACAVARGLTEEKEPSFDDPNINAHYLKAAELVTKFPEAFEYIKAKLGGLQP
jgi:hypothetical protein